PRDGVRRMRGWRRGRQRTTCPSRTRSIISRTSALADAIEPARDKSRASRLFCCQTRLTRRRLRKRNTLDPVRGRGTSSSGSPLTRGGRMRFESSRPRGIISPRATQVILAVGQRAFVHHPGDSPYPVAMTDDQGVPAAAALRDGDEVEILAWRPRGSTGTRYRVRRPADGANGWLAATELRR